MAVSAAVSAAIKILRAISKRRFLIFMAHLPSITH